MEYQIRPFTNDDVPRVVELINAEAPEPTTVEDWHRNDSLRAKEDPVFRLVAATKEDDVIGYGMANTGHLMKPGHFGIRVRVDKEYRGHGAGSALYEQSEAWAKANGAVHLESGVRDQHAESIAWAEKRGFMKKHHIFESTLDLKQWDPSPFLPVVEQAKTAGIRFTTLADEMATGRTLRDYFGLSWELVPDIPGWEDRPFPTYEEWEKWVTSDPRFDAARIILAADEDRWVALADLQLMVSGALYNGFTAVNREYRGRGLSLAIKVFALQWASQQGFPYIRTNNHSANQPMLATNRKLGYVPSPGFFDLAKTITAQA